MTSVNGHGDEPSAVSSGSQPPAAVVIKSAGHQLATDAIKDLIARLEVPFHTSLIEWRVINTGKKGKPRGQVIPYADPRAYTDRLNDLLTPAGWTRHYQVHTSPNFEREKDAKTVAKFAVTCELTLFGVGSHSATGEEWADDPNAVTSAEAQAFKRAAACFGLGRYLYHFSPVWVDLNDRKRPKKMPRLAGWATPDGWREGLRPAQQVVEESERNAESRRPGECTSTSNAVAMIRQIEALQEPLGRGLYRGLLRTIAQAWQPGGIKDEALLRSVLKHMQAAQRGLLRLDAALNTLGRDALQPVLRNLKLRSLDKVDNLKTLEQIVLALETLAGNASR